MEFLTGSRISPPQLIMQVRGYLSNSRPSASGNTSRQSDSPPRFGCVSTLMANNTETCVPLMKHLPVTNKRDPLSQLALDYAWWRMQPRAVGVLAAESGRFMEIKPVLAAIGRHKTLSVSSLLQRGYYQILLDTLRLSSLSSGFLSNLFWFFNGSEQS